MFREIFNWSTIIQITLALVLMYLIVRYFFKNSILFKIGVSTATVIILASFISSTQVKLGPIHVLWSFPLQAALAVGAYYYINRMIKLPLVAIIEVIGKVSEGDLEIEIEDAILDKKDEIGRIGIAMRQLQKGLREKGEFARNIGEGKLDEKFEKLSEEDDLGEALLQMQASLKAARTEDEKRKAEDSRRNWITEGQARFAEILRQNAANVEELSYNIISNMVRYMDINQGGLFILNDEDENDKFLELTACYAFDRRKFLQKRIDIGEGLAGICFIEGETIYMTQVPQDYIRITSGLGDQNPDALVIVPLKLNEEVFGVMELASFKPLEKHQIEFAEKVGEIIASSISGLRINTRTAMLLEKSQQQAEEMRAQEEEMRQNMEELSATQEAMAEKDRDSQEKLRQLSQENEELRARLKTMEQELDTLKTSQG